MQIIAEYQKEFSELSVEFVERPDINFFEYSNTLIVKFVDGAPKFITPNGIPFFARKWRGNWEGLTDYLKILGIEFVKVEDGVYALQHYKDKDMKVEPQIFKMPAHSELPEIFSYTRTSGNPKARNEFQSLFT